jgi:glyoxylase-like metal-dependent hydrolase (beta-lactamase superfamily II)
MIEEIAPNIYRTEIPLPRSPLKWLNSYIVKGGDRFLIIDTGFNREECLNAMNTSLQKLGVDLNKTDIFITHFHVDHMGLAGTLAKDSSKVYLNEEETRQLDSKYESRNYYWQKIIDVYVANGFADAETSMHSHPVHKYGLKRKVDFTIVKEGDMINIGDFHFRCVATPGHSPGHTSLYEANKKILVAGDHILFDITPNISYWVQMEDSLGQYLDSLEKVNALDAKLVLTGHRRLVHDLQRRVKELQEHHRTRLNEVLVALGDGEKNVFEIAPQIKWDITAKTWEEFPPPQKWFAFGETMAHVKYLEAKGKVKHTLRRPEDRACNFFNHIFRILSIL